jgi:hypothetical protein
MLAGKKGIQPSSFALGYEILHRKGKFLFLYFRLVLTIFWLIKVLLIDEEF